MVNAGSQPVYSTLVHEDAGQAECVSALSADSSDVGMSG